MVDWPIGHRQNNIIIFLSCSRSGVNEQLVFKSLSLWSKKLLSLDLGLTGNTSQGLFLNGKRASLRAIVIVVYLYYCQRKSFTHYPHSHYHHHRHNR